MLSPSQELRELLIWRHPHLRIVRAAGETVSFLSAVFLVKISRSAWGFREDENVDEDLCRNVYLALRTLPASDFSVRGIASLRKIMIEAFGWERQSELIGIWNDVQVPAAAELYQEERQENRGVDALTDFSSDHTTGFIVEVITSGPAPITYRYGNSTRQLQPGEVFTGYCWCVAAPMSEGEFDRDAPPDDFSVSVQEVIEVPTPKARIYTNGPEAVFRAGDIRSRIIGIRATNSYPEEFSSLERWFPDPGRD